MRRILLFLLVFLSFSSGAFLVLNRTMAMESCHGITDTNANIPSEFSSPWNIFTDTIMMKASCLNTNNVQIKIGTGDKSQYIWHELYYTKDGKTWEVPKELTGDYAPESKKWIAGQAAANINITKNISKKNYIAAYICEWNNEEWKCGCTSKEKCTSKGKWSLQFFDTSRNTQDQENTQQEADDQETQPDDNVSTPGKDFPVYDMTMYTNKPDNVEEIGFKKLNILYEASFYPQGGDVNNVPSEAAIRDLARYSYDEKGPIVNVDLERWKVPEEVDKYKYVLDIMKDERPDLQIGFFNLPPKFDYWRAINGPDDSKYKEWQKVNDRLQGFADAVDILFPNGYTFYEDVEGWKKYAKAQIDEARRLAPNKPVYLTIWPQYHDSEPIGWQYVPADYFRAQLELAKQYADGVVIWGGWTIDRKDPWDENAPWWQEVKDFLGSME